MKLKGSVSCANCNNEIKWYKLVTQDLSTIHEWQAYHTSIKESEIHVLDSEKRNGYTIPLRAKVNCPKCGYDTIFQVPEVD